MNVAQRLYLIAAIAVGAGGAIYAKTALDVSEANSDLGRTLATADRFIAQNEIKLAQLQHDAVALDRAQEQLRIASMSADERFQGQRYFAYGLMGLGALFGMVGFVVSGARGQGTGTADLGL